MTRITVGKPLAGVTEVKLARAAELGEWSEWKEFAGIFLTKYFDRPSYIISSDQDWSLGRELPHSEAFVYGRWIWWRLSRAKVFFTPIQRVDVELAGDIVENGDFDMGFIWITTQNPRSFFPAEVEQEHKYNNTLEWARFFTTSFPHVDIWRTDCDGEVMMFLNEFKDAAKTAAEICGLRGIAFEQTLP